MLEKLEDIIVVEYGFAVYGTNEPYWELRQHTPAGEDWIVDLEVNNDANTLVNSLRDYVNGFDIDYEVEVLVAMRGTHGVPGSIKTLLEDAEWKYETLKSLLKDIENFIDNKKKTINTEFEKQLIEILDIYAPGWHENNEPLDGDEVDCLVEHLRNQLNLINGNITQEEYEELEG